MNASSTSLSDVIAQAEQKNLQGSVVEQTPAKVPLFGHQPSTLQNPTSLEEKKEPATSSADDLLDEELGEDGCREIERIVDEFIAAFGERQQKEKAIKYTVTPLNQIVRMPNEPKWRNVSTTGSFLKQVSNINAAALENFFEQVGFTKTADKTHKF